MAGESRDTDFSKPPKGFAIKRSRTWKEMRGQEKVCIFGIVCIFRVEDNIVCLILKTIQQKMRWGIYDV